MTEFELLQLEDMYLNDGMTQFMNYVTILSGYVAANYFVAKSLTARQFWIMSITYSIIMIISIGSEYSAFVKLMTVTDLMIENEMVLASILIERYGNAYSNAETSMIGLYMMLFTMFVVFLGSLLFAHSLWAKDGDDT